MGNIQEVIAKLAGLSSKQSSPHTIVADLGGKGRLYALYEDDAGEVKGFTRLESLKGVKNNPKWQKQPDSPEQGSQTIYLRVQQDEPADDEAIVYPSLVRTRTGYLVQLAV